MRILNLATALVVAAIAIPILPAQQQKFVVPRLDLSVGYNYIKTNAPPGGCECFGLQGGYVSAGYRIYNWLGVSAKMTGGHANDISALGQNLTLTTFAAGPRLSKHYGRFTPFAEGLFGVAHGSDSYFPTATTYSTTATSLAIDAGGGLDINLSRRFALRAVDASYLRTSFNNAADNSQNHLQIGAGIVVKFGGHMDVPPPPPAPMAPRVFSEINFKCSVAEETVEAGQPLEVTGFGETRPDQLDLSYTWATSGGRIQGAGRRITIDTTALAAGEYRITGRAALVSSPSTTADCETKFHVHRSDNAAPAPAPVVSGTPTPAAEKSFHENVQDALFDYDSYKIRPDGQVAIDHAADYLKSHPEIQVTVGGYSDERGSAEYNLALGEKRASAARDALISAGVDADRVKVISFGKEAQVCTALNEVCFQQNRRAAFNMHY